MQHLPLATLPEVQRPQSCLGVGLRPPLGACLAALGSDFLGVFLAVSLIFFYICTRTASFCSTLLNIYSMAKLPTLWLQGASQRMAGAVVYQQAGRTLGRSLAQEIKNPRTPSQMSQRIKLANLVKLYQVNRSWAKLSFETKPRTWSDYNAFVSANLAGAVVYLTKPQVAAGSAVVAPVKVTSGTLSPIILRSATNLILSNLYTENDEALRILSVAQFSEDLIKANPGLREGDQLSVILYYQQTDPQGFPYVICRAYEMILSLSNGSQVYDYLPEAVVTVDTEDNLALAINTSEFTGGAAVVISRTTASETRVSTSYICLTDDNTVYPQFTSSAAAEAARQSYGQGDDIFLESRSANDVNGNAQLATSLLSVKINDVEVARDAEVSIPIAANTPIEFTFSQPITAEPASLQLLAGGRNTTTGQVPTGAPVVSGSLVRFTPSAAIGTSAWTAGSSFHVGVKMGGVNYIWTLKVASNSMD